MRTRYRVLMSLLALVIGVSAASLPAAAAGNPKWLIMVYMAADNDLEPFAYLDLEELEQVGSTGDVVFLVLVDRAASPYEERLASLGLDPSVFGDWSGARILLVRRHPGPGLGSEVLKILGDADMGDPGTLVGFMRFAAERFHAEHYMLVLWNHGSGFSVAVDEGSRDSLDMAELREALGEAKRLGLHLDIVGFDACLMSSVETVYAVSDYADYMVASPETEPGRGWPYDDIARLLAANPGISPRSLAEGIVSAYGDYYTSRGYRATTLAALDLREISSSEVADAMRSLAGYATENPEALRSAREEVREYGVVEGVGGVTVDFLQLAGRLGTAPKPIRGLAAKLEDSLVALHAGEGVEDSKGVTLFYPRRADIVNAYEKLFPLSTETGWANALRQLVNIKPEVSEEPVLTAQVSPSGQEAGGVEGLLAGAGSLELNGEPGDEIVLVLAAGGDEEPSTEVYAATLRGGRLVTLFDLVVTKPENPGDIVFPIVVLAGDYDGDGIGELVIANQLYVGDVLQPVSEIVYLDFAKKPDGRLAVKPLRARLDLYEVEGLDIGDLDGDGRPELVIAGTRYRLDEEGYLVDVYAEVVVADLLGFKQLGTIPLRSRSAPGTAAKGLALIDADGDGDEEIVAAITRLSEDFTPVEDGGSLVVLDYGRGGAKITGSMQLLASDLAAGDIDGDGVEELAVAHGSSVTVVELGKDGAKRAATLDFGDGYRIHVGAVDISDIDGDGVNEVIAVTVVLDEEGEPEDAGIRIVSLAGKPSLEYSTDGLLNGQSVAIPLAVDLNGDHVRELAFIEARNMSVYVRVHNISNYVVTNGTIRGRVLDSDGHPVTGATVEAVVARASQSYTAPVDAEGRFVLDNIPAASYELLVHKDGLVVATAEATVKPGEEAKVEITLVQAGTAPPVENDTGEGGGSGGSTTHTTAATTTTPTQTETDTATTPTTTATTAVQTGTTTATGQAPPTSTSSTTATGTSSEGEHKTTTTSTAGREGSTSTGTATIPISIALPSTTSATTGNQGKTTTATSTASGTGATGREERNTQPTAGGSSSSKRYYAIPAAVATASLAYILLLRRREAPPPPPPPP